MRLTKKQLTKLSKIDSTGGTLITRDGISFVRGTTKTTQKFVEVGYFTDLPDSELPLTELKNVISRLSGASVSIEDGKVNFRTDKVSLGIRTEDNEQEPFVIEGDVIGVLDTTLLKDYAKFCDKGKSSYQRPALQGVNFSRKGICATDAHTMRFNKDRTWEKGEITVPFDVIDLLLDEEYEVVRQENERLVLRGDNQVVSFTSLNAGNNYPDWPMIIPATKDFSGKIELESKGVQKELQFLKTIHNRVELFEGKLSCNDEDLGIDAEVSIEGNFNYEHRIAFDPDYLLKIAKECVGDITLSIKDGKSAVVVEDEVGQTFIIMPVMIG